MISRTDVEHIALLARIELSGAEIAKFEKELSGILAFVEKLNEADTANVEPLSGGATLEQVTREDALPGDGPGDGGPGTELVEASPRHRDGYVEVKAVFENR